MKTITELKEKLIDAIDGIDTSKLTICDLKLLSETVKEIASINDKPFDFMDVYSKICPTGLGFKQNTLSDLKGGK